MHFTNVHSKLLKPKHAPPRHAAFMHTQPWDKECKTEQKCTEQAHTRILHQVYILGLPYSFPLPHSLDAQLTQIHSSRTASSLTELRDEWTKCQHVLGPGLSLLRAVMLALSPQTCQYLILIMRLPPKLHPTLLQGDCNSRQCTAQLGWPNSVVEGCFTRAADVLSGRKDREGKGSRIAFLQCMLIRYSPVHTSWTTAMIGSC